MLILHKLLSVVLGLLSAYLVFYGINLFILTGQPMRGTEFGMLIDLLRVLGLMTVWLGVFAIWAVVGRLLPSDRAH
ncbi:MAG: hypothetical protein XD36_3042 [Halomonas sp. 54_146]|nr:MULTISPECIES: hypothetical protein [unclassified Halomonas]KUJ86519.1 MAG: hypothetical protein XD36_3042 [Halomonas sp. 54_146]HAA44636.1 hypothetical protein [Halomonas sp.]